MRPILLDMHGFASFREPTRVDFSDADFFALVGPTGSGKSTVIDAMTFALYGSVPRWARKGMVSLALAPTVGRGTVKLVFEVGRQRYVVARELRRTATQVSQRSASLERIVDPNGLGAEGEETVPLAGDLDGVNEAVERLLGLSYEHFTQCVVLPQGKFADFLQAKPAQRQEIVLSLLGAEHYRQMMMKANQRASAAAQRADTIAETLNRYADATPEAQARARAAEAALAGLGERVAAALPLIAAGQRELADLEAQAERLRAGHAALSRLRIPGGAAALSASLASSRAGAEALRAAERSAESADKAARSALAAAPARAALELARERRAERGARQAQVPGLETRASELTALATAAADAVAVAAAARDRLRDQRDQAAQQALAAADQVDRLTAQHTKLTAVSVPAHIDALQQRATAAADAATLAARALEAAEQADRDARAAVGALTPEVPLARVSDGLGLIQEALSGLPSVRLAAAAAAAALRAAEEKAQHAEEERGRRQAFMEDARRSHVAAGLRPHLVAGEPCPVCEQPVRTLPPARPAAELDDAQARLREADQAVTVAASAARAAGTAAVRAEAGLKSATDHMDRLVTTLAGLLDGPLEAAPLPVTRSIPARWEASRAGAPAEPGTGPVLAEDLLPRAIAEISAIRQERAELERAASAATATAEAARRQHRKATADADSVTRDLAAAAAALRAARDPLVELGAPQAAEANLADAWARLVQWAANEARACAVSLSQARTRAGDLAGVQSAAVAAFSAADQELARLRDTERTTGDEQRDVHADLAHLRKRIAELDELLRDAPDEAAVTESLALLDELEKSATEAGETLRAAREERIAAEKALADLEQDARAAHAALSAARDAVVGFGAPVLNAGSLLAAWTELVSWAAQQASDLVTRLAAVSESIGQVSGQVTDLTGKLSADLAGSDIDVAPDAVAARAQSAVAAALAGAQAATQRVRERRAEAADLARRQQAATEEQRTAKMLGDLLRADNFQRWLVSEAVDDLVATASTTLAELSGGQFDLTHADGDFYVIDHADAESRRSVRTLSGGETFQASLALALALSSQIAALAAAGAARLDSIFLDEGFGTLDPETLEVVATTLETLAQGDRMVGVVSHVAALAERVPVRFRVSRNARTSTVTREAFIAEEVMP